MMAHRHRTCVLPGWAAVYAVLVLSGPLPAPTRAFLAPPAPGLARPGGPQAATASPPLRWTLVLPHGAAHARVARAAHALTVCQHAQTQRAALPGAGGGGAGRGRGALA